jgi:hypothetical protein
MPQMSAGMTFTEVGTAGLRFFGGYQREEWLPELSGRNAARIYREMRDNSPIIGGILFAIQSTMRKVSWRAVAAADTPEAQEMADFAESLMDDMSSTWEETIIEGLSMLEYGFAPQEIVYKRRLGQRPAGGRPTSRFNDGMIGWRRLPIRGQDTVLKWFFDPNGGIKGLTQQPYVGPIVDIPIEKLLLFRPKQHKNNPEGYSIIRNAYRSYFFTKRIEEQEAILFERLNGVPIVSAPQALMEAAASGDTNAVSLLAGLKKIAINLRLDEQMGIVIPSDTFPGLQGPSTVPMFKIELLTPGQSRTAVSSKETIGRHELNMTLSVLCDFLQLGHESRGTQALSVSKQDLFFQAIEGYLNSMAAVYNRFGLPRIWALNGLDPDLMPTYEPDLAQRTDLDVLGNFILRLSQAGMPMFPNPDVESALLDAAGLPDIAELSDMPDGALNEPPDPTDDIPAARTPMGKLLLGSLAHRLRKGGYSFPTQKAKRRRHSHGQLPLL